MKILLIEDDIFWRTELMMFLEEQNYDDLHICKDIHSSLIYLERNTPDIIIADVLLNEQLIFDALTEAKIKRIPILFMTISEDPKLYQFSKNYPLSLYLIKPFHKISLKACLDNLLLMKSKTSTQSEIQKSTKSIVVRGQFQEKIALPIDNIIYIRSELAYCIIKTNKAQFAIKYSLQKILEEFQPHFLLIHRAFIVNKTSILKYDLRKMMITTEIGEIPISRMYKKDVLDYFNSTKFN